MKKHFILISVLVVFLIYVPGVWARTASGLIVMQFDLSAHPSQSETQLWIPYPVSDENQLISDLNVIGDFNEYGVYTDRHFKTPILYARWGKGVKSRKLTFSFKAERNEVIRRDFPAKEPCWNPVDYAEYLAPTSLGPTNGVVKSLAERITAGKTTVLGKAKAIYDWVVENMHRDPKTRGCGIGDVSELLRKPGGKCVDISSVYIALARSVGVPSREEFTIRLGKKPVQDITTWQHCYVSFFLPGYGWVPIDPADVLKMMLVHNLKLGDPRTVEYRKYFWGGVDPYRIVLSHGRNLILNPPQSGRAVNYLMYPYAQVGEKALDWLDPKNFKYTITYRKN